MAILKMMMHSPATGMAPHCFSSRDLLLMYKLNPSQGAEMSPAEIADHQTLKLHKSVPKAKKCIALIRTTQCMSEEIRLFIIHLI